jgi:hypothetical protein
MIKRVPVFFLAAILVTAVPTAVFSETSVYGNKAAADDMNLTIEKMLRYAVEDEYLARAEYNAIMDTYGTIRPFSSIEKAEENHINIIKKIYSQRNIAIPPDEGAGHAVTPPTLRSAFETGIQAEIDNIAMYERFLNENELDKKENEDVKNLFQNLKQASENHLRAFRRQLEKY